MLAQLRREGEATEGERQEAQRRRLLADHLDDYESQLKASRDGKGGRQVTDRHVSETMARIRGVVRACKFTRVGDIALDAVQAHLAARMSAGPIPDPPPQEWFTLGEMRAVLGTHEDTVMRMIERHNLAFSGGKPNRRYPRATLLALLAKQRRRQPLTPGSAARVGQNLCRFASWLARRCGVPNPLADLAHGNLEYSDHVHDRRPLLPEELPRLLAAARDSRRVVRGLRGVDRWALYLAACGTGLRAGELSQLLPEWFALDATPPTLTLPGRLSKNGKTATQPLPADVATGLSDWMKGKPIGLPLWPGSWSDDAADVLRIDLKAAGIPYIVQGPEGSLYADFHALRHTYGAALKLAGVPLCHAMQLMRHGSPVLTARVYGRADLGTLGAAVEGIRFTQQVTRTNAGKDHRESPSVNEKQDAPPKGKRRKGKARKEDAAEPER